MTRSALVLSACSIGLGLMWLGDAKVLHAWTDQSLTSLTAAAKLETPVELNFDDVPLRTAVEALCRQANIDVTWDDAALAEVELPADETVALKLGQKVSLRSALNLILEPLYLASEVQGDRQLRITSRQRWNERAVTVSYNVRDLLATGGDISDLAELIQNTVQLDSWQIHSPSASGYLMLVDGEMQVTQRRDVQQEIAALLAELRERQASK